MTTRNFAEAGLELRLLEFNSFIRDLRQANEETRKFNTTLKNTAASLNLLDRRFNQFNRSGAFTRKFNNISRAAVRLADDLIDAGRGVESLSTDFDSLDSSLTGIASELRGIASELRDINRLAPRAGSAISNIGASGGLSGLLPNRQAFNNFNQRLTNVFNRLESFRNNVSTPLAIGGLAAVGGTALIGSIAARETIGTIADIEAGFVDVSRTLEGIVDLQSTVDSGIVQFTDAGNDLRTSYAEISNDILPLTLQQLTEIGTIIGQLDFVPDVTTPENLDSFVTATRVSAGLEIATDLTATEAAQVLTQLQNITGNYIEVQRTAGEQFERNAGLIVALGNESITSEQKIAGFVRQLQGAGNIAGLTDEQIITLATGLADSGLAVESAGSSVSFVLEEFVKASAQEQSTLVDNTQQIADTQRDLINQIAQVRTLESQLRDRGIGTTLEDIRAFRDESERLGRSPEEIGELLGATENRRLFNALIKIEELQGQINRLNATQGQSVGDLQVLADLTGRSVEEFQRQGQQNVFPLILDFFEGLNQEGPNAVQVLEDLGFNSRETSRALLGASANFERIRGFDELAQDPETFEALNEEIAKQTRSIESQLQFLENNFVNLADYLRDDFAPIIRDVVDEFISVSEVARDRVPSSLGILTQRLNQLDLSGFQVDLSELAEMGFDKLDEAITDFDPAEFQTTIEDIHSTIETLNTLVLLGAENWDILSAAFQGIIAGGVVATLAGLLSLLATPLGLIFIASSGLAIAWETNFLGIQHVTETVAGRVTTTLNDLLSLLQEFQGTDTPEDLQFQIPQIDERPSSEGVLQFLAELGRQAENIQRPVDDLTNSLIGLTEAFDTISSGNSGSTIGEFAALVGAIFGGAFTVSIATGTRFINAGAQAITGFLNAITGLIEFDRDLFIQGLGELGNAWLEFADALPQSIGDQFGVDVSEVLRTELTQAIEQLRDFETNDTALGELGGRIGTALGTFIVTDFRQAIQNGLVSLFTDADRATLEGQLGNIQNDLASFLLDRDVLAERLQTTGGELGSILGLAILNGIGLQSESSFASTFITDLNTFFEQSTVEGPSISFVRSRLALAAFATDVLEFFPNLITQAQAGINTAIDDAVQDISTRAIAAIPDVALDTADLLGFDTSGIRTARQSAFEDLGLSIPQGIQQGIDLGLPLIFRSVDDMTDLSIERTKENLESRSPSGVFERQGQDIIAGLVLGLSQTDSLIAVIDSINRLMLNQLGTTIPLQQTILSLNTLILSNTYLTLQETFTNLNDFLEQTHITTLDSLDQSVLTLDLDLNTLVLTEQNLFSVLSEKVNPALQRQDSLTENVTESTEILIEVIGDLVDGLGELENAYNGVGTAINGLNEPVLNGQGGQGGETIETSATPFAAGGRVPNRISSNQVGPTGGMLAELHRGEIVLPRPVVRAIENIPSSNNTTTNTTNITLQVANPVSDNFIQTARVAKSLGDI